MATAAEKRKAAVNGMKSRAGKNSYSQARPGNFWGDPNGGRGKSDCSDSVRQAVKRATGIDIGGNTSAIIDNRGKMTMVEDNRDGKRSYPTLSKLKPADLILYKGNTRHTWDVGHVEMNEDGIHCYGHGSGMGPVRRNIKTYSQNRTGKRKYLCVLRPIKDDDRRDEPAPVMGRCVLVTGGKVNVRKGPSTKHAVVAVVKSGERYAHLETDAKTGWHKIDCRGKKLWISHRMCEVVG